MKEKINSSSIIFLITVFVVIAIIWVGVGSLLLDKNKYDDIYYKKITTCLYVNDIEKSSSFYENVLGFKRVKSNFVKEEPNTEVMRFDKVEIILKSKSENKDKSNPETGNYKNFKLYIETKDIKELFNKIKNDVLIISKIDSIDNISQEFTINDLDGFNLTFVQEL